MTTEERAADFRVRLRADMEKTVVAHFAGTDTLFTEAFLDALVEDAMHPIEHLLVQSDELVREIAFLNDEVQTLALHAHERGQQAR